MINKLNISEKAKKILAAASVAVMIGGSAVSFSGCSKNDDKDAITFSKYLNNNKEELVYDDIIEEDDNTIEIKYTNIITNEKENDNISLGTAMTKLESIIKCYRALDTVNDIDDFDKNNKSYETEFNEIIANGHNVKDINKLISDYYEADNIEKIQLSQQLKGLYDYYKVWINNNTQEICEQALLQSIKVTALDAMGVDVENYKYCKVAPVRPEIPMEVYYDDPITNPKEPYKINYKKAKPLKGAALLYSDIAEDEYATIYDNISYYNDTAEQLVEVLDSTYTCDDFVLKNEKNDEKTKIKNL